MAAERLKHHTVFFTALYWLVSSLAHSWTDFFFFFLMHGDMNSCYRCCWMSERGTDSPQSLLTSLQIQNINYNDRLSQPQLLAVSVSLCPVDSPMRPHQKGWLWKQLIQPIFTFVVRLGPLVAVLIITVAKEEATWSSMKSKNILPWEEVGAWIGSCSCPLCDQKLMFSFT